MLMILNLDAEFCVAGNAIAFGRTTGEVINIVTLNGAGNKGESSPPACAPLPLKFVITFLCPPALDLKLVL